MSTDNGSEASQNRQLPPLHQLAQDKLRELLTQVNKLSNDELLQQQSERSRDNTFNDIGQAAEMQSVRLGVTAELFESQREAAELAWPQIEKYLLKTNIILEELIPVVNERIKEDNAAIPDEAKHTWTLNKVQLSIDNWKRFVFSQAKDVPKVLVDLKQIFARLNSYIGSTEEALLTNANGNFQLKTAIANTWLVRFKPLLKYVPLNIEFADVHSYMDSWRVHARLLAFKTSGGHAFISAQNHYKINNTWKSWGVDGNFITTLSTGDALFLDAEKNEGIKTLEKRLGINPGDWYNDEKVIWRYMIDFKKLDKLQREWQVRFDSLDLRAADGHESGSYAQEHVSGGYTLGGANEAMVSKTSLTELGILEQNGVIIRKRCVLKKTPLFALGEYQLITAIPEGDEEEIGSEDES